MKCFDFREPIIHTDAQADAKLMIGALKTYQERKEDNLFEHPLTADLQACTSPSTFLDVIQEQVRGLDISRLNKDGWRKWIAPAINIFFAFAAALGALGLVLFILIAQLFEIKSALFAGGGVLYSAVKDARARQDDLSDAFERIKLFLQRLELYTEAQLTAEMMEIAVQIMVEILSILDITMNENKQSRTKRILRRFPLIRSKWVDVRNILDRLDKLTQEEGRMAVARNLNEMHRHNVAHGYVTDRPA